MTAYYNLIDVDSGNLVGSYRTEKEARDIVRASYMQYGEDGFRGLALLRVDDHSQVLIAEEDDLAREPVGGVLIRILPEGPKTETVGFELVIHGPSAPSVQPHHNSTTGQIAASNATACTGV
jgi:hypothetical protein